MSKLEKLIQQYCPDGVEWKQLGDICNIKGRIGFRGYTRNDQVKEGEGALSLSPSNIQDGQMDYSKGTYITWQKYEESPEIMTFNGDIVFCKTASVGKVALVKDLPYKATINPQLVVLKDIQCNSPFLAYVLGTDLVQNKVISLAGVGSVPNISQKALSEIEIPVPPLPVQEEIVRVLDTFTELQKRLQQYEYYKKQVFLNCSCPVQYSIDEICTKITDGSHFSPKSVENGYHMPSVKDMLSNGFDFTSCKQISEEDYKLLVKNGCQPKVNDILIAKDGSMLKYAFPVSEEMPIVVLSSIAILSVNTAIVKPAFLAYYFKQKSFKDAVIREYSTKGGVPRIVLKNFKRIEVSIPSLEEQQRIVAILDRFDTLTNDLTSGLPAEIEKRRQQYEFYRDKLLTFKRKEA